MIASNLLFGIILIILMGVFSPEEYFGGITKNFNERKPFYAWLRILGGIGALIIFLGATVAAFVGLNNGVFHWGSTSTTTIQYINQPPPFWINYSTTSVTKLENGLSKTVFNIWVLRTGGNFQVEPPITKGDGLKNVTCSEQKSLESSVVSSNDRQLYELQKYEIICISVQPIIDNKHLFGLEYNYVEKEIPESIR